MDTAAETAAESNMKSPSALGQPGPPSALVANPAKAKAKEGITPCTSTIPRLISVTEIIKREYLKRTRKSLVGLHQYTEMACLEDLDEWKERQSRSEGQEGAENGDAEATLLKAAEKRAEELKAVLGGKRQCAITGLHPFATMTRLTLTVAVSGYLRRRTCELPSADESKMGWLRGEQRMSHSFIRHSLH